MKALKLMAGAAASVLLAGTMFADIMFVEVAGLVTVNGVPKDGVTVEVVPCAGAVLPSDWPAPAPGTASTLPDAVTGQNYAIEFFSAFGDGTTPGPAGSFTFLRSNGAWFTAVDAELRFTAPGCAPVTVSCEQVRQAYEASLSTTHPSEAFVDLDIICSDAPLFLPGDTATIGFWGNKKGQALIKSLNGGPTSTALGDWLASNFPYLWGAGAGANNLTGQPNSTVASRFLALKKKKSKVDAQILTTALAVYVTDSDLAGDIGTAFGFNVSADGLGAIKYNVGAYGAAIGLLNDTQYTVFELLQQASLQKQAGTFNSGAFGFIFTDINNSGDRL